MELKELVELIAPYNDNKKLFIRESFEEKIEIKKLKDLKPKLHNAEVLFLLTDNVGNVYITYKKAIEILKDYVDVTKRRNEKFEWLPCICSCGFYKDISQQEYELLEEVLGNDYT